MRATSVRLIGLITATSLSIAGCSGSSSDTWEQKATEVYVESLPSSSTEMNIALVDGTLPCGLGQVKWGRHIFRMEDYPVCESSFPDVTVYCLTDQAQWTGDSISIIKVSEAAKILVLESQREGTCGIFPGR